MNNELFKRIYSSILLIPICVFLIFKGGYIFNFFIFACFLLIIYEWHKMCFGKSYYILGYFFLTLSFYSTYNLRNEFEQGLFFFLIVTSICIFTDIGGYVFGKIFKGPKLTKISPKKTYSGIFGGYIFSILFIKILFFFENFFNFKLKFNLELIIFILLISLVSQIGDLIISYFKRLNNIKDTGNLIPGHGGILDRVDGLIFVYPFSLFLLKTQIFNILK